MRRKTILLLFTIALTIAELNAQTVNCGGVERWDEKVLTDPLVNTVNFTPITTTIAHLVAITTPTPSPTMPRYQPVEDSTYIVTCKITIKKAEADSDFHLVLSNGTQTLIGEIPDPICASVAASSHAGQFQVCRNFINAHIASGNVNNVNIGTVTVTGVAFIDPPHGQTGAAPNNLELHPIINIYFLTQTDMEEYNLEKYVSVSPNPSDGKFHIQTTKYKFQKMDVYNSNGGHVLHSSIPDLDLSAQPNGTYFLRIHTEKGDAVKKIVKE